MSTKYGFRIGNIGIEFISKEDRDKAIKIFTQGSDVSISDSGVKYSNGKGSFSVYDRDTNTTIVTCKVCKGEFSSESCTQRDYPEKYSWNKSYQEENGYICDACFAKKNKDKELFDAKKLIEEKED